VRPLLFACLLLAQQKDRPAQGAGAEPGKPAPAFKLKSQDGKVEVDSAALKGKPALLIFGSYT
jgi:cytochrome oxidase Cu insertion factor (SCO1/SenC/PrrC family)